MQLRGGQFTLAEHLLSRVSITAAADCWLWFGRVGPDGYGTFRSKMAHRLVYTELVGPVPDGLQLDHRCRNRQCVNPLHLEPVSAAENHHRGINPGLSRGAEMAARTHCPKGHEYTADNTYARRGKRECRTCRREGRHATARK